MCKHTTPEPPQDLDGDERTSKSQRVLKVPSGWSGRIGTAIDGKSAVPDFDLILGYVMTTNQMAIFFAPLSQDGTFTYGA